MIINNYYPFDKKPTDTGKLLKLLLRTFGQFGTKEISFIFGIVNELHMIASI